MLKNPSPGSRHAMVGVKTWLSTLENGLLDDLSQITFVLDDMSQKGAICTKIIWTICHNFVSTWTICHTFILDDLSQVIFVTILFWMNCHKSYMSQTICLKKRTVIWGDT